MGFQWPFRDLIASGVSEAGLLRGGCSTTKPVIAQNTNLVRTKIAVLMSTDLKIDPSEVLPSADGEKRSSRGGLSLQTRVLSIRGLFLRCAAGPSPCGHRVARLQN